ncbi:hypothetical protein [Tumebacillus lipolyticus]|uniref:Uncharacterized protein n=1 Tax=Tumebacillus lipolyticus TaxID=1280370 RepID=A0ABW4ZY88_9BACL
MKKWVACTLLVGIAFGFAVGGSTVSAKAEWSYPEPSGIIANPK